jgi:hypothetical protein
VDLRQLLAAAHECEAPLMELLALIWAVSAAVCFEAYVETRLDEKWKWQAILIGSLTPVFNTLIAYCYVRDKMKR